MARAPKGSWRGRMVGRPGEKERQLGPPKSPRQRCKVTEPVPPRTGSTLLITTRRCPLTHASVHLLKAFNEQSKRSGRACPQVHKPAISPTNQSCCLSPHMQTWVLTSPLVSKQCQRHSVERTYLHVYTSVCHEYERDDGHVIIPPRAIPGERDSHLHTIGTNAMYTSDCQPQGCKFACTHRSSHAHICDFRHAHT